MIYLVTPSASAARVGALVAGVIVNEDTAVEVEIGWAGAGSRRGGLLVARNRNLRCGTAVKAGERRHGSTSTVHYGGRECKDSSSKEYGHCKYSLLV
jgi:hypothetical protein